VDLLKFLAVLGAQNISALWDIKL